MRVMFTLQMENLVVKGQPIDALEFCWEEDLSQNEVLDMSRKWITTRDFLTARMIGLDYVGEAFLTIEPIEPIETE